MRRYGFVVLATLLLGYAAPAFALLGPETSLGARIGGGSFQGDTISGQSIDFKNPTSVGVVAGIRQERIGGELSVDWIKTNVEGDVRLAEAMLIPILLTAQFHLLDPGATQIDPYLGVGVGYYLNSANTSSEAKKKFGSDFKAELDNAVGFHFGAGVNFKATTAVVFALDLRYALVSTDLTQKGSGASAVGAETVSLNGLMFTAGVKYLFPK